MAVLSVDSTRSKANVFEEVGKYLQAEGFRIAAQDFERPWGGFFVIDESQIREFQRKFFPEITLSEEQFAQKLSPKFLVVAPEARLSWQYHHRRAELWNLLAGKSSISRSENDQEGPVVEMEQGKVVSLRQGERHRLIGIDSWGVVAEIWMHTDSAYPSDESDIVRLQDDYSRT